MDFGPRCLISVQGMPGNLFIRVYVDSIWRVAVDEGNGS